MNLPNSHPLFSPCPARRLPIEWLERPGASSLIFLSPRKTNQLASRSIFFRRRPVPCGSRENFPYSRRAFTILEMMIVIGIIGLLTSLALPHLKGMTKANAMTTACRQLVDDINLARQRALVNRSQVCMVFLRPGFWTNNLISGFTNAQINSLYSHQYAAYAIVSLRTVGDQPGQSNVHYLTDWKYLPSGTYIAPYQFTNAAGSNLVSTTNTLGNISNGWYVSAFPTNINFPFPSTFNAATNILPYISFLPNGQLAAGSDQFIMLTSGGIFYPLNSDGTPNYSLAPDVAENPPGSWLSNPNVIHIDALTSRAKIERNQF